MEINAIFIRYILVGALNTAFGYGVFGLMTFMGIHYSLAILFATIVGVIFNFITYGRLVFKRSGWKIIWRFIGVYGALYMINIAIVYIFLPVLLNVYVANGLATGFIAVLGFHLNKRYVYEKN